MELASREPDRKAHHRRLSERVSVVLAGWIRHYEDRVPIFDTAVIYQRDGHWQFRMWLPAERKYVRKTLNTRHRDTAIERGKDLYLQLYASQRQGKRYFSITAREGVARYVAYRQRDVEAGLIVKGRLVTIKAHLKHWVAFIGADTRLTELDRGACEDYYHFRIGGARRPAARQTTIVNEQATINAMMLWLSRQGDARIDGFDFRKLPRLDRGDESIRRSTFEPTEVLAIREATEAYCNRRLHGPRGFERAGRVVVNPSYYSFATFRALGWVSGDAHWRPGTRPISRRCPQVM